MRRRDALTAYVRGVARRVRLRPRRPGWARTRQEIPSRSTRVLLVTSIGSFRAGTTIESVLASALAERGVAVDVLLCDSVLDACMECTIHRMSEDEMASHGPRRALCGGCFEGGKKIFGWAGANVLAYSDFVNAEDLALAARAVGEIPVSDVAAYEEDGLAVGEHALAGALRFFARATLEDGPLVAEVVRRYLRSALLTKRIVERVLDDAAYDVAVFHHGIYVPQGIVGEVMRARGVRVVNWNAAYRKHCFIFSHGDTYHHTLLDEEVASWEHLQWNERLETLTMDYLRSRWTGAGDWIWFHENPVEDIAAIKQTLGLDPKRPVIGLLTNVMWDAQLHYPANAFDTMIDWCTDTIRYFADRSDLQLVIRVHPAEIRGSVPSRQRVVDEIAAEFPVLPPNVRVIPPESTVSTYAVMGLCDTVTIYGTKTGVELTAMGIPVIVAGEAWIRGKGMTLDAASRSDYLALLEGLPIGHRLDPATVERARKYAFHFFFRRMIPLPFVTPVDGPEVYRAELTSAAELRPGRWPGLDVICDGILTGSPFVFPAETAD